MCGGEEDSGQISAISCQLSASKEPRSKLRGIRGLTGVDPYGEG